MKRQSGLLVALVLGCLLAAEAPAGMFKMPNPEEDVRVGRLLAQEFERTHRLTTDAASQARVERIGRALVDRLEERMFPYQFKVVASREVNAVCMPGGYIYVYEGLLARCDDDDVVAAVLGHEIAHAFLRHWALTQTKLQDVAIVGVIASVLAGDTSMNLASTVVGLTNLRYSRKDENQADDVGIALAYRAGFDPQGAIRLFTYFQKGEKGKTAPTYLRTHPPAKDRLRNARLTIDKLVQAPPPPAPAGEAQPAVTAPPALWGTLPVARTEANPWFPLAVGNEWRYKVDPGGALYTFRITATAALDQGAAYRAETLMAGGTVASQVLATATEVWLRPCPAAAESPWRLTHLMAAPEPVTREGWTYQVVGTETLDLPCGRFPEALHLRRQGGDPAVTYDEWFAAGVGLLKRTCAQTGVTETLVRYAVEGQR